MWLINQSLTISEPSFCRARGRVSGQCVPMYESARLKVDHVMGPQGPLTVADLPTPDTRRWTIRRKAEVVAAVCGGLMSLEEACRRYALNQQEFLSWQYCIDYYGLKKRASGDPDRGV